MGFFRLGNISFIAGIGVAAFMVNDIYQQQFASTSSMNGPASTNCLQSQPKKEVYRTTEFFLLTCPHCKEAEHYVSSMKNVVRRHVLWEQAHEDMARFSFALEKIGRTDLFFAAEIEAANGKTVHLYDSEDGKRFAHEQSLDINKMKYLHISQEADQFLYDTRKMQNACNIKHAPVFLKNGVFSAPSGAGDYKKLLAN